MFRIYEIQSLKIRNIKHMLNYFPDVELLENSVKNTQKINKTEFLRLSLGFQGNVQLIFSSLRRFRFHVF